MSWCVHRRSVSALAADALESSTGTCSRLMPAICGDSFPLETQRLTLRPVGPTDAGALHGLYSDWEVAQWLSRLPWPFTETSVTTFVADAIEDLRRGSGCVLAMLERTTNTFVGVVSLRIPALEAQPWTNDTALGVLGYAVVRHHWGNAFASEGAERVTEFAFDAVGLARLRATVLRSNVASRRVLERLGFTVSEFDVQETPRYGGPPRLGDTYVLDRRDWTQRRLHGAFSGDEGEPV
jgi:ribosomal-protein-alanine N-acetyltransferase